MTDLIEYKCPSCGASLHYDIKQNSLSCSFCKNTYDPEYMYYRLHPHIVKKDSDFDWVERSIAVWEPFEVDHYVELDCPSCNAKIITRSSTAASVCPFCGNAVIKSSNFKRDIRPDKVIPFKIPKQVFADKYMNYISDIRFIPKEFKDKAVINKIVGCYIPVWSYSCTCETTVDYSFCSSVQLKNYPILANESDIKSEVFYSLWPFDFNKAEVFNEAYLSGYFASRYSIGAKNAMENTDPEIKNCCSEKTLKQADVITVGPSNPDKDNNKLLNELFDGKFEEVIYDRQMTYYLIPIWLLNITCGNKTYTFAMNGQTGNMYIDDIPEPKILSKYFLLTYLILQLSESILGSLLLRNDISAVLFINLYLILFLFLPNLLISYAILHSKFKTTLSKLDLYRYQKKFKVRDFIH